MFSIYGLSGPLFQGSLENLSRLPPVSRRVPVRAVRPVTPPLETESLAASAAGSSPATRALEEYRSVLPESLERGPLYEASQIMQTQVITLAANDEVAHAWQVLVENRIHQAPVLDDTQRLVGIVGDRNVLTTLNVDRGQIRDVLFKRVRDVMTTPVVAAAARTDIRQIARVMLERDVEGVPVVDEAGRIIGFISRSDILRAVITDPPLSIWR